MFGHESKPSKIYSYGAHGPLDEKPVLDQMRQAHEYRNGLARIEIERRSRVAAALATIVPPRAAEVDAAIKSLSERIVSAEAEAGKANSAGRKRGSLPKEKRDGLKELRSERKKLYAEQKEIRRSTFGSPAWKKLEAPIEAWAKDEQKKLRAGRGDLFWGTYLSVEQAAKSMRKGAPPEIERHWDGTGRVVVQLQGGLPVRELMDGGRKRSTKNGVVVVPDQRLRVEARPDGVWASGSRKPKGAGAKVDANGFAMRKLGTAMAMIRIGSDGKKPVWAEVPFTMHRPMPDDASVKWAWLIRRRVGLHFEWGIQFTLSKDEWAVEGQAFDGVVGIDIGWRLMDDPEHPGQKRLRVAVWEGSDGRRGEVFLPGKLGCVRSTRWEAFGVKQDERGQRSWIPWHEGYAKTEELQALRDDRFNTARDAMATWLEAYGAPAWLRERMTPREAERPATDAEIVARIRQWRAPRRLALLVIRWRENRVSGDESILADLETWRGRDKHFRLWQDNQRGQLQRQRFDSYRCAAAALCRDYATFVIEARSDKEENPERPMDLRAFHKLPAPDAPVGVPGEKGSQAKEHVRDACLSSLRLCLKEKARCLETFPAPGTTIVCHACGSKQAVNKKLLMHTCTGCGVTWDQDVNAAKNLLARRLGAGATSRAIRS